MRVKSVPELPRKEILSNATPYLLSNAIAYISGLSCPLNTIFILFTD